MSHAGRCPLMFRPWTADEVARMRRLWQRGWSSARIGARLGRTRNSILGKLWRVGEIPRSGVRYIPPQSNQGA